MNLIITAEANIIASNIPEFEAEMSKWLKGINLILKDDADFEEADRNAKKLKAVETAIKSAREKMLKDADQLYSTLQQLDELASKPAAIRLELEKGIKLRKEQIKRDLTDSARAKIDCSPAHRRRFDAELDGATKGCRSFASMEDRLTDAVTAINDRISDNRATINLYREGYNLAVIDGEELLEVMTKEELTQALSAATQRRNAERERMEQEAIRKARIEAEAKAKQEAQPAPAPTPQPRTALTEAEEWAFFKSQVFDAFSKLKIARGTLTNEANIAKAQKFADGCAAAWKNL